MTTAKAPRTILDIHIVQTVPPSNLNRDDTGSPKTCVYGGVRRARVSSQSWKRAIRKDFMATLEPSELGTRTKRLVERLIDEIAEISPDTSKDDAMALAVQALKQAGISTKVPKVRKGGPENPLPEAEALAFLSYAQLRSLAQYSTEVGVDAIESAKAKELADTEHSIDIALFGRMVASNPALNVDAACQVAHAVSTHAVANEFDYYTAVDDGKQSDESLGAGMVGVVEFNSATLYRFATVDLVQLAENLGDNASAVRAAVTFATSMISSMPSGKQNTFANRTLPDAVVVSIREDQPVNFVAAFEPAVRSATEPAGGGFVAQSVKQLAAYGEAAADVWGNEPVRSWVLSPQHGDTLAPLGAAGKFRDVLADLDTVLTSRLVTD